MKQTVLVLVALVCIQACWGLRIGKLQRWHLSVYVQAPVDSMRWLLQPDLGIAPVFGALPALALGASKEEEVVFPVSDNLYW
mgnify:CR=1 FL=1